MPHLDPLTGLGVLVVALLFGGAALALVDDILGGVR